MNEIAVAIAAATEPIRMSRCLTCISSCAITPSTSSGGSVCRSPCVAQTTACFGPRPVANALGCAAGEIATVGIGNPARSDRRRIMAKNSGACASVTIWALADLRASLSLNQ